MNRQHPAYGRVLDCAARFPLLNRHPGRLRNVGWRRGRDPRARGPGRKSGHGITSKG